ncbi:MAG: hypothetical protein ACI8TA_002106 [Cyclobacteriaceae bacterium]|jgi:hypothetical protein
MIDYILLIKISLNAWKPWSLGKQRIFPIICLLKQSSALRLKLIDHFAFHQVFFIIFELNCNQPKMIKELEKLREDEIAVLLKAPVYVTILIAGADGEIDKNERKEAIELARIKQSKSREKLGQYYKEVGESFEQWFNELLTELPSSAEERNQIITSELRKLNFILPKIDKYFGIELHASLKDIAKKIAESSGGVLGYLSISFEESKLVELKMINDPSK